MIYTLLLMLVGQQTYNTSICLPMRKDGLPNFEKQLLAHIALCCLIFTAAATVDEVAGGLVASPDVGLDF